MIDSISSTTAYEGIQNSLAKMEQVASVIADPASVSDVVSLSSAAVAMKEATISFAANIQAIKASNDALGTLIDSMA
jgi:hypothetical protein